MASDIKKLEEELIANYSIGLDSSEEVFSEVMEARRQTLKDSSKYDKNYKSDYIDLLVNYIEVIIYSSSYGDRILTLKESFIEDIKKSF